MLMKNWHNVKEQAAISEHSFVHIDPGNSVAHLRLLPEAERMPKMKLFRVSGYCCAIATTAPTYSLNNA
jgi:hypothetical protein